MKQLPCNESTNRWFALKSFSIRAFSDVLCTSFVLCTSLYTEYIQYVHDFEFLCLFVCDTSLNCQVLYDRSETFPIFRSSHPRTFADVTISNCNDWTMASTIRNIFAYWLLSVFLMLRKSETVSFWLTFQSLEAVKPFHCPPLKSNSCTKLARIQQCVISRCRLNCWDKLVDIVTECSASLSLSGRLLELPTHNKWNESKMLLTFAPSHRVS